MIARLSGLLAESAADHAVIDVGGVGYLVQASTRTLSVLGAVGGQVMVFTEMQVREDAMTLFALSMAKMLRKRISPPSRPPSRHKHKVCRRGRRLGAETANQATGHISTDSVRGGCHGIF